MTNAAVWTLIALLAAALFSLIAQIRRLDQRMSDGFGQLHTDFGQLRGEFGALRGEFGELRGEFGNLRGEFAELRADFRLHEQRGH